MTLRLAPAARWVVEYYQVEETRPQPDGSLEVDLLVADRRWLERLVLRLAPHAHGGPARGVGRHGDDQGTGGAQPLFEAAGVRWAESDS